MPQLRGALQGERGQGLHAKCSSGCSQAQKLLLFVTVAPFLPGPEATPATAGAQFALPPQHRGYSRLAALCPGSPLPFLAGLSPRLAGEGLCARAELRTCVSAELRLLLQVVHRDRKGQSLLGKGNKEIKPGEGWGV